MNHGKIESRKLLCYPYTHCMFACSSIHGNEIPYALLQGKRINIEGKRIKTKRKRERLLSILCYKSCGLAIAPILAARTPQLPLADWWGTAAALQEPGKVRPLTQLALSRLIPALTRSSFYFFSWSMHYSPCGCNAPAWLLWLDNRW